MPFLRNGIFLDPAGPHRPVRNKTLGAVATDGRKYEICPACSDRASLRTRPPLVGTRLHEFWTCESCGYVDCDSCPGGRHDLMKSA